MHLSRTMPQLTGRSRRVACMSGRTSRMGGGLLPPPSSPPSPWSPCLSRETARRTNRRTRRRARRCARAHIPHHAVAGMLTACVRDVFRRVGLSWRQAVRRQHRRRVLARQPEDLRIHAQGAARPASARVHHIAAAEPVRLQSRRCRASSSPLSRMRRCIRCATRALSTRMERA